MIAIGKKLPEFALADQTGEEKRLADLVGRKGLVIYAYPKDNTSGCTVEALEFTQQLTSFRRRGFNVVGISKDSVKAHCNFIDKHELRVALLSDPEAELLQAMGAWGEKKSRGRTSMGIIRSTVVVSQTGTVLKTYPKVKAKGHAEQVLAELKSLS
jgi:thioredoxin-dependent peroxiredoxin